MPSPAKRGWSLSQLWRDDEEMASKKDDDLALPRHAKQADQWQAAPKASLRWTAVLRLVVYAAVLFTAAYGLFRVIGPAPGASSLDPANLMPLYDRPRPPARYDAPRMEEEGPTIKTPKTHKTPKPQAKPNDGSGSHSDESKAVTDPHKTYNGPLKLPNLGPSLQAIVTETSGRLPNNRNVLFAAASLQSAALLLPMACQMAAERQNYVHFALMSRSEVPIKELLAINGIDKSCAVIVHGRGLSTKSLIKYDSNKQSLLDYINIYMHPQAIVVDTSTTEENYFLSGLRDEVRATESTLIELPERSGKRLSWFSKLDASALAAWNDVSFDILIHAPQHGTGNLKRLLKSLARADLAGVSPPRLTIELPTVIQEDLNSFLGDYEWPPRALSATPKPRLLSLRHRIPRQKLSEEESSVRFLESFWPTKPSHSHVLVLSPHTEVTPQFFHYVKYSLLQRRYSSISKRQDWESKLFGISFSAPTTYLDDTTQFTPPKPLEGQEFDTEGSPFLWQGPNSDTMLIFGDRWVELHGYVSRLLEKQHASSTVPDLLAKKEVGKTHPAWLEYMLQLSRIRGYFTLYPTRQTANAVVGIHSDLHDMPEEYEGEKTPGQEHDSLRLATEMFDPASQVDMLATLPHEGDLPLIYHLPWLTWDGKDTDEGAIQKTAANYKQAFRKQVGECKDESPGGIPAEDLYAKDLFCFTKGG
ncbi:glycosyltransferase 2 [Trichoderma arundinaceum]|uniref:Glycosyltransferase 2 n=1 Tax=Trichoderma arundinaceum TaxID=490622 RepID=A0A395NFJ2_TRIAR|nr:glycosyltransferase 2 [Trichoderma arundinaceum]